MECVSFSFFVAASQCGNFERMVLRVLHDSLSYFWIAVVINTGRKVAATSRYCRLCTRNTMSDCMYATLLSTSILTFKMEDDSFQVLLTILWIPVVMHVHARE